MSFLVRRKSDGAIRANNGCWMEFSGFGNVAWAYKSYRKRGYAQRLVNHLNTYGDRYEVIELKSNQTLNHHNLPVDLPGERNESV